MFRRDGKINLDFSEWDRNRWVNGPIIGREIGPDDCRDYMGLEGFVVGRETIGERLELVGESVGNTSEKRSP